MNTRHTFYKVISLPDKDAKVDDGVFYSLTFDGDATPQDILHSAVGLDASDIKSLYQASYTPNAFAWAAADANGRIYCILQTSKP